jgi:hypothetical protein
VRLLLCVNVCVCLALSGCSGQADNLPRVVICDGQPLEGAAIVLMQDKGTYFARGMTDSQGRFSLDAYESKRGAVPGEYLVTISKTVTIDKATQAVPKTLAEDAEHAAAADPAKANASWVNDLPDKYNSPKTSGLSVTIPDSGTSNIKFEISRS